MDDLTKLLDSELTRPSEQIVRRPRQLNARPGTKAFDKITRNELDASANSVVRHDARTYASKFSRNHAESFKHFEEAVGGRDILADILRYCPKDNLAYNAIQKLFSDTDFNAASNATLAIICDRNKVSLQGLLSAFKDAKVAQIAVDSIIRLSKHAPEIVDQIGNDAKNRFDPCAVCDGSTRIPRIGEDGEWLLNEDGEQVTQLCYECRGTGQKWKEHDTASRKHFLELVGLSSKGSLVQQTFNQAAIIKSGDFLPGDGSFEQLIRAIDKAQAPVQQAEVIDVEAIPHTTYEAPKDKGLDSQESSSDPAQS